MVDCGALEYRGKTSWLAATLVAEIEVRRSCSARTTDYNSDFIVLYTSEREGDDEKGAGSESRPFKTILQVRTV